jgi:hypothetical protein
MRAIALAVTFLAGAPAWAEEPAPDASTTTSTLPARRSYPGQGAEPEGLPTGLPGFGSPPVPPERKEAPPGSAR